MASFVPTFKTSLLITTSLILLFFAANTIPRYFIFLIHNISKYSIQIVIILIIFFLKSFPIKEKIKWRQNHFKNKNHDTFTLEIYFVHLKGMCNTLDTVPLAKTEEGNECLLFPISRIVLDPRNHSSFDEQSNKSTIDSHRAQRDCHETGSFVGYVSKFIPSRREGEMSSRSF